ncbi:hypothetical protein ACWEFJ_02450 [Actinosynnema sp. NPDC004786]
MAGTLPADFPPWPAVHKRFAAGEKVGATQRLLDELRDRVRLADGRVAVPSAVVMDSQSVPAAETVGRATRGWDVGKKIAGRKRHIKRARLVANEQGWIDKVVWP